MTLKWHISYQVRKGKTPIHGLIPNSETQIKSNNKTSDNKKGKSNTPFLWEQYAVSLGAIRRFSESNSAFC